MEAYNLSNQILLDCILSYYKKSNDFLCKVFLKIYKSTKTYYVIVKKIIAKLQVLLLYFHQAFGYVKSLGLHLVAMVNRLTKIFLSVCYSTYESAEELSHRMEMKLRKVPKGSFNTSFCCNKTNREEIRYKILLIKVN